MFPYRHLLADGFARLHPALQQLHGSSATLTATGQVDIQHGATVPAKCIARLMRLPAGGREVPLCLKVKRSPGGEHWSRSFPQRELVSRQTRCRHGLHESFRMMSFDFGLCVVEGNLKIESTRFYLLGLPMPRRFAPHVSAVEWGENGGWRVHVEIQMAGIGLLLRYSGRMSLP
ncbi:MAG: DUF4166 domain-containing protein [Planctomycetaceae bacterium]|nr:DUF4166 domain-containing protein [Planctomycetaceae bacterium]